MRDTQSNEDPRKRPALLCSTTPIATGSSSNSSPKTPADFVFANTLGRPFDYRDAEEGFRKAVKAAGLQAPGKLTLHSLRHGFASLLIAKGLNVVFLSRRLGHANPNVTLEVYAHLFEHADHSTAPEQRWKQAARRSTRQRP